MNKEHKKASNFKFNFEDYKMFCIIMQIKDNKYSSIIEYRKFLQYINN